MSRRAMSRYAIMLAPLLALNSPAWAASGRDVPKLDVRTTCRSPGATAEQSGDSCLRDELGAKSELVKVWGRIPADIRKICVDEVSIGGSPSYVELLTCAQMNEWSRSPSGGVTTEKASAGATSATPKP